MRAAAISNLRAARAFPEGTDFRLEFDVVIPLDSTTMRLVEKYYKSTCFLTMNEVQMKLPEVEDEASTAHQESLQDAADSDGPADSKPAAAGDDTRVTISPPGGPSVTMTGKQLKQAAKRAGKGKK